MAFDFYCDIEKKFNTVKTTLVYIDFALLKKIQNNFPHFITRKFSRRKNQLLSNKLNVRLLKIYTYLYNNFN